MAQGIEDIQTSFIEETRALAPELRAWLDARIAEEDEDAVMIRWATGLGGHPRFLDVYRRHYMMIEELNARAREGRTDESDDDDPADLWGTDDPGVGAVVERADVRLITEVEDMAPDIADIVIGVFFNPIGLDPDDQVM